MISIRRLFGLLLLFLFFEVAIWVLGTILLPDVNILLICGVMTAMAVAIWLVYILVMRWMMRPRLQQAAFPRTAAPISTPVAAAATSDDPDVAGLRELIRQAEERLASSPGFANVKQKPRLAELPMYLVIGSEGCGKTSALLKGGLEPHLLAGEAYREGVIVPTKICNIYFTGESIIVDLAGRIFDDPERWSRVVPVLLNSEAKKPLLRRIWDGQSIQRNLRGVVLGCGLNTFGRSGDPQRTLAVSQKCKDRLEALGKIAGAKFPVYALFTRADSLPYFDYFFSHLSDDEERQLLGCTLPLEAPNSSQAGEEQKEAERKRLSKYFNRIYASLANKRLLFLARETAAVRKGNIYEFPREFKRIRSEVVNFLVDTFRPNPLQPGPQLRGYFFSGVRQVASTQPAEELNDFSQVRYGSGATVLMKASDARSVAVAPSVMRSIAVPQERTIQRWTFLLKFFREIVLLDQAGVVPAATDSQWELSRTVGFGAVATLCLLLSLGFVTSLTNNRQLAREVEDVVRIAQAAPPDPDHLTRESLERMEALRDKAALLSQYHREGPPWKLRWGLYIGDSLLADVHQLYFAQFRRAFLVPVLGTLTTQFSSLNPSSGADSYDDVYERLKAYRTVSSGGCSSPDRPLLSRVLPAAWLTSRSLDGRSESLARRQITYYVDEFAIRDPYNHSNPEDLAATNAAQSYLLSFRGPEQLYRGLIASVNQPPQRSVRVADYAPQFAEVLTGPSEVSASFTRQGWDIIESRIRQKNFSAIVESCVVGSSSGGSSLTGNNLQSDVEGLYIKNYIKTWHDFLSGQAIAPYRSVPDAVSKLGILSGNRSPLLGVLLMISDNTNFPNAPPANNPDFRKTVEKSVETGLGRLFPGARKGQDAMKKVLPQQPAAPSLSQTDIFNVFQPVRSVVKPGGRDRMIDDPNRGYIDALANLKAALDALPHDNTARLDVSMNNQARQAIDAARAKVRDVAQHFNINSAQGTDIDLTRLLEMPIEFTDSYIPKDPRKPLRDKVNGQLHILCSRLGSLQRKFPFNPQADAEATEQDLASVFAPGTGALWSFQQLPQPLTGLLIKQGDLWMQNPAVQDPRLTPEFLDFFNRLATISTVLFPEGSTRPHLQYSVQPLPSEGVDSVKVNISGTVISSTGHPVPVSWPPPLDQAFVDLQLTMNGLSIPFGRYEGQWAIFRMVQDGEPQSRDVYLFRSLRQGHGKPQQVTNAQGLPVAVRLMLQFPGAFDPRTFRAHCPATAAQ